MCVKLFGCPSPCSCVSSVCYSLNTPFVTILVSSFLDPCVNRDRIIHPKDERILLHGDGVRSLRLRPWPEESPLRGVRRRILQARRGVGAPRRGNPPFVSARGKLPAPYGSPRHHGIVLERGDLPVSGKLLVPSRNQPTSVSAGPAQLIFISAGPVQLIFVSAGPAQCIFAGPAQLVFVSAGPAQRIFAGPAQLVFVSAGSAQFRASRAPPRARASRAPSCACSETAPSCACSETAPSCTSSAGSRHQIVLRQLDGLRQRRRAVALDPLGHSTG